MLVTVEIKVCGDCYHSQVRNFEKVCDHPEGVRWKKHMTLAGKKSRIAYTDMNKKPPVWCPLRNGEAY